jgi:dihydroxyacetone kinase-like protein
MTMAERFDGTDVVAAIERVATRLIALRDRLNQLDAAVGDGDLGITAAKGASALREFISASPPEDDLGRFFFGLGRAFNNKAPSTMGTLLATAVMRAGREVRGSATLDDQALVRMLTAADAGIQERGKAQPGDKTVVDALHPAAVAFSQAIAQGQGREEATEAMLQAAREGRDAAISLRSKIGRSSWVGERTEGQPDPGTVLLVQILEAVVAAPYTEPGSSAAG